jgi:hypothetical protein
VLQCLRREAKGKFISSEMLEPCNSMLQGTLSFFSHRGQLTSNFTEPRSSSRDKKQTRKTRGVEGQENTEQ